MGDAVARLYIDGKYIGECSLPKLDCNCAQFESPGQPPQDVPVDIELIDLGHPLDAWIFVGYCPLMAFREREYDRILPPITVRRKSLEQFFMRVQARLKIS